MIVTVIWETWVKIGFGGVVRHAGLGGLPVARDIHRLPGIRYVGQRSDLLRFVPEKGEHHG